MKSVNVSELNAAISSLVDAWCERRAIDPLRVVLGCYPMVNALTDDWGALAFGFKTIRARFCKDLPPDELEQVIAVQHLAETVLSARM